MFKRVSWCIPAVNILNFGQFNPLCYSSLFFPSPPHPHYSTAFNTSHYDHYLHRCNSFQYRWLSLFSFPFSFKCHRIVLLLQTCSTYKCVYDHVYFWYIFILWIYLPNMKENMWTFSFSTWFISLNIISSCWIHSPSNYMVSFSLMTE
jgi:hypothetical protein